MQLPFYQKTWFNIELEELAKSLGHNVTQVADSKIYSHVYRELNTGGYNAVTEGWIKKKHNLSAWIRKFLNRKQLDRGYILSVGCGLGIVEQPLIDQGLKINLQECQDVSIKYLIENYPKTYDNTNFILTEDLSVVSDSCYDTVMAITSTYCLNDAEIIAFLRAVYRILKKGGTFLWYETALGVTDGYQAIKKAFQSKKQDGIFWGWKRSKNSFIAKAINNDFVLGECYYFSGDNEEIKTSTLFGMPINLNTAWQMVSFQKND